MKTVTFSRKLLAECAKQRPPEYMTEMLKARVGEDAAAVTFDSEHPAYVALLARHRQRYDLRKLGLDRLPVGRVVAAQEPIEKRGPALWARLHKRPLEWPGGDDMAWLQQFSRDVGCGSCASHWFAWVKTNRPDFSSAAAYFEWSWRGHEHVNAALGKPAMPLDEAKRIWGY